jgi:hypothetical protein
MKGKRFKPEQISKILKDFSVMIFLHSLNAEIITAKRCKLVSEKNWPKCQSAV